jgi:alpha-D-ribose 1-methylphosphonate 5-triphosphate diphosphatase
MTVFTNAKIVLPGQVFHGAVLIADGRIAEIGSVTETGLNLEGDFLVPGVVDLHTDNLERQVLPRSNARWPSRSAMLSHDAQCAAAGVTTVFDALCLGDIGFGKARAETFESGLVDLKAFSAAGILKTDHFLHLRCELPAPEMPEMLARTINEELVRLISLMDHSPGMGQYADISKYEAMRAKDGFSAAEIAEMVVMLQENHHKHTVPNRKFVLEIADGGKIPLASHDDRTAEEIARNHEEGIDIAEFPVSMQAAQAARAKEMRAIAGAPNIVRGGSHSGNVSAMALVRDGLVQALASDYVPAAMLEAAFRIVHEGVLDLPAAIALVTSGPADMVGLTDRGRIAVGQRADLVRVRMYEDMPVIRAVWRGGERIA